MKNVFLGLALACLTLACASEKKASMSDAEAPNAPKAECSMNAECSGEAKAECSTEAKSECSGEKKVCPMTGKVQG